MRTFACVLAVAAGVGCSSEAVNGTPGGASASDQGAPAPTGTADPAGPGASGDFAPTPAYPSGPYGHGLGAVIDNLDFIGWRDPVAANYDPNLLERIHLADFYDPTGTRTELLVINASAVWCVVCQGELRDMNSSSTYQKFRDRKVEILGTLFEDAQSNPAKPSDLSLWGSSTARAIAFPLVLDPALKMGVYFTSDATPLNIVVDARTMTIVDVMMGYDPTPGTGFWGRVDQELQARGL